MNTTANRLRLLREAKQMSQKEVAEFLGITRAAYNKYESGASRPVRKLEELSKLFNVSTDYIMGQDETPLEKSMSKVDRQANTQVSRYLKLSRKGQKIVDITLNAVYEMEKKHTSYRERQK